MSEQLPPEVVIWQLGGKPTAVKSQNSYATNAGFTLLDDLRFSRVVFGQRPKGVVYRHQVTGAVERHVLRRRDIHDADTAPVGTLRPAAGDVDQDVPHQPRRDCQEVGAVLPTDVTPVHQADKRFVHQRGRLKHVAGPLAPEVPASDLAQFRKQGGPMTRMAGSLVALSIVLLATSNARADDVTDWNETMLRAGLVAGSSPLVMTRNAAMVQAAVFDAVNGVDPRYTSIHVDAAGPAGASRRAAAVQARIVPRLGRAHQAARS